jgi:hypothetical protein
MTTSTGGMLVPGKIFISYRRRDDPGGAGRLFDALNEAFDPDRLFLDVDSIEPGQDFVEVVEDRVAKSAVLLAVIGQHWIDASDDRGNRRLDNAQDYVRIEIESAMKQGKRVIPVLIGDAKMPAAEVLPESLSKFARHNAVTLRYERFHDDTANLVGALKRAMGDDLAPTPPPNPQSQPMAVFAAANLPEVTPAPPKNFFSGKAPLLACAAVFVALALASAAYFDWGDRPQNDAHDDGKSELASASQPGWCRDPNLNPAELRVCGTPGLLMLDKQLDHLFDRLLDRSTSEQAQAVRADEAAWLRDKRNPCAQNDKCLGDVYQERITYFTNMSK